MRFVKENHRGLMGNPFDRDYFDRDNIIHLERLHVESMPGTEHLPHMPKEPEYDLELSLPGFKREEISISVDEDNRLLNIVAEKPRQKELREKPYYIRREYTLDSLARNFTLPDHIDKSDIETRYEVGILKLRFPHQEERPGRAA
jgi:HSP20 family molecular chaperone IbpA